jgi:hypothetical protein
MATPDLTDLTVLVDVPDEERYRCLLERDGADGRPPMNTSSRGFGRLRVRPDREGIGI